MPQAKGYASGGNSLPDLPPTPQPHGEEATATVPTQSSSDPGRQQVQQGKAGPHSTLALSRSEQIKSVPEYIKYREM